MKRLLTISFLYGVLIVYTKAQVVSGNVYIPVLCCPDEDSIDIGNDGSYEIRLVGDYFSSFQAWIAYGDINIMLSAETESVGFEFDFAGLAPSNFTGIAAFSSASGWIYMSPNGPTEFLGFAKVNAPADTTFGWIELDLNSGISDSMIIIRYAYSTTQNEHLYAGQTSPVGVIQENDWSLRIYPNPTTGLIRIENSSDEECHITLFSSIGTQVMRKMIDGKGLIDISALPNGVYFLEIESKALRQITKVVKN